jgi:uncharacterized protein (DUF58 family)
MTLYREARIATLLAAPAVAAIATLPARSARLLSTTAPVLGILWLIMTAALAARAAQEAQRQDRTPTDLRPAWHQLDVLTATGCALIWTSAGALIACGITGWASLSVLGVVGLGTVFIAATWTAIAAGGDAPWRRATVTRAIVPEIATEGDPLREQLHLTGVRIPAGMRLFATGRAMPDGPTTRYAIGADCSHADVRLASELGPAQRGEHVAPAMALWLGDVLGLTRTQPAELGEARCSVLPRPAAVDGVRALLGAGGDDAVALPTQRQPTEGAFRIRNYIPGDDARRIHWVRSLQTNRLVVRLADEIPQAEPAVRLILDNDLWGADALACRQVRELLDALVRVWLGVARALTDGGTRVTLVAIADRDGAPSVIERPFVPHASRDVLRLAGRLTWQTALPLGALVADDAPVRQVIVSSRSRKLAAASPLTWIVVPEVAWTSSAPPLPARSFVKLPYPAGCADNRLGRRRLDRHRHQQLHHDHTILGQVMCRTELDSFAGELIARPQRGRVALEVIP